MVALLLPAVSAARGAARRTQSKDHLKQIGLAFHYYHDVFNTLPPSTVYAFDGDASTVDHESQLAAIDNDEGIAHHSWMTGMLPYIEQANLYSRIDTHEPWNSGPNFSIAQAQIPAYLNPAFDTQPVQGFGASHYAANSQVLLRNRMSQFRNIRDGLSNTIFAGEVSKGFAPWASPGNVRDPAAGLGNSGTQFYGADGKHTQALMGDGSVRVLSNEIEQTVLELLADPADGEMVPAF